MTQKYASVEPLVNCQWQAQAVDVSVLRLDLLHPNLSGNKYFKLKHNLSYMQSQGVRVVLSFGGAYSNHIHALAYAAKAAGIKAIGVIRGEPEYASNPTLMDASAWGMELRFVSREQYKLRADAQFCGQLAHEYDAYVIPEGGSNQLAMQGCGEIVEHVTQEVGSQFDKLIVPCGTGSTLAGIAGALPADKEVLGVAVLKGEDYLRERIRSMLEAGSGDNNNWRLLAGYHQGGYAKCNKVLAEFIKTFPIPIEPVYSAKMFWALDQLISQGYFEAGTKIVAVHTGGMQGLRGMQPRLDKLLAT